MGTYSVKTARGTYSFQGDPGMSQDDVLATIEFHHPDAFTPPKDAPLSDFVSYLKQGAIESTQAITQVAGVHNAAADFLERQKNYNFSEAELLRQQRAAAIKKEAEGKGMVAGGLAALKSIAADPYALPGQAIGSLAPFAAPVGVALAAAVAPEAAGVGAIAMTAEAASAALGLAAGAGGMKQSMYNSVKDVLKEHGISDDKAEQAALEASKYTGPNAAYIAGGGLLGIIDSVTGVGNRAANAIATRVAARMAGKQAAEKLGEEGAEQIVGKTAAKAATKGVDDDMKKKAEESIGHAIIKDTAKEMVTEGAENAFQQYGTNVAQSNAGVQTDPFAGVAEQAVEGVVGGGLAGGLSAGALQYANRKSLRMAEAARGQAAATATPAAAIDPEVQKYMDAGSSREEAERAHAYNQAKAGAAGAPPPTGPSPQPVVRGTEPVVPGAVGAGAAPSVAGEVATAEAGGLAGPGPTPGSFTSTTGFSDSPIGPQKKERRANPIAKEAVKSGLDDFVRDNGLGITVPDAFVDKVHAAAQAAHVNGEELTLPQIIEKVTPDFNPPKTEAQTARAIKAQGVDPKAMDPADITAVHQQVVAGRGLVDTEQALINVAIAKQAALNAPPATPSIAAPAIPSPTEQVKAQMEAPPETSSSPPEVTDEGQVKTVADADITAKLEPKSLPQTDEGKAKLAEVIAQDQTKPDPALEPDEAKRVTDAIAQGGDPTIYEEAVAARERAVAENPPAEPTPAPVEATAPPPPAAPPVQEAVSEAPPEAAPVETGAEAAPAPVEAGVEPAPEPAAGEAAPAPEPVAGEVAHPLEAAATDLNPDNAAATEDAVNTVVNDQVDAQEAQEAAAEAAKPPPGSRARKEQIRDKLSKAEQREQRLRAKLEAEEAVHGKGKRRGRKKKPVPGDEEDIKETLADANTATETHDGELMAEVLDELAPRTADGVPGWANFFSYPVFKKFADVLPTSSLTNLFKYAVPHLVSLKRIIGLTRGYHTLKLKGFDEIGRALKAFGKRHGFKELANAMSITKSAEVNPLLHETRADALANDVIIKAYRDAIKDPANRTKRGTPFKEDLDALERREKEINLAYDAWEALGEKAGGQEIYSRIKDFHRYTSNTLKMLRDKDIRAVGLTNPKEAEELVDFINSQMDPESYNATSNGKHAIYKRVDAKDAPKVYFPSKRYGKYWLGINDSPAGRQYYMFETYGQRERARKKLEDLYGEDAKAPNFFASGESTNELMQSMRKESAVVQQMMHIVDTFPVNATDKIGQEKQRQALRDALFQTYLRSLPERSLSKNMIHYQDITGASQDILRNFGTTAEQIASLMTTLKYGAEADVLFRTAQEYIRPSDGSETRFSRLTTEKLEYVLKKVHERLQLSITPPDRSSAFERAITALNRLGVVEYLSSAGTAIANMTAIPFRVAPHLVAQHGPRAIPVLLKHMDIMDTLRMGRKASDGTGIWTLPSMMNSPFVQQNPTLKAGMEAGERRGVFSSGYDMQVGGRAGSLSTPAQYAAEASRLATKFATLGLASTEIVSREMAYSAAFQLQIKNELKKGGSREDAIERAADHAADVVSHTIGEFSSAEYPNWIAKGPMRALFLFRRFSVIQTKFLLGSTYSMLRAATRIATGSDKKASAKLFAQATGELSMSLGMVALFAGITGMPMYGMLMWLHDLWDNAFLSQEEKDERRKKYGEAALNADLRFRYHDLPRLMNGATVQGLDGFPHYVSSMMMNGPISELTDANIGSRVGIDGLWFRGLQGGSDTASVAYNTFVANVAGLSMGQNMIKGMDDINNGEATRGLEKILPAGVRGFFTDYRYLTEGARTRDEKMMMNPEDFTPGNLIGIIGGLQPTKLAVIQSNRIDTANEVRKATAEKSKVMEAFKKSLIDHDRDPTLLPKAVQRMRDFNAKYPLDGIMITGQTLQDSVTGLARDRAWTYDGTTVNKKNALDILPTIMAAAPPPGGLPSDYKH